MWNVKNVGRKTQKGVANALLYLSQFDSSDPADPAGTAFGFWGLYYLA
jgi:hypothetical protein